MQQNQLSLSYNGLVPRLDSDVITRPPKMAKKNYDHMFSVILIGDAGVGKSKLVNGYLGDSNTNMMPTTTWGIADLTSPSLVFLHVYHDTLLLRFFDSSCIIPK